MTTALAADEPEPYAFSGIVGPRYAFVDPPSPTPFYFYPVPANAVRSAAILETARAWLSETRDDTIPLSSITINPYQRRQAT